MKRTLPQFFTHLLIAGSFVPFAQAQQGVLTSDELMPTGTVFIMRLATDAAGADTTVQGENVTWDFTDLLATGESLSNEVLNPATSPHIAQFPTANFVLYEAVVDRYSYFVVTESYMERIGVYRNVLITYSDPQREYEYPISYGTSHSDDWANDNVSFPGTIAAECIGTGSLQLPGQTYDDVLLVRVRIENVFPFFQYLWLDANNGMYLVNYITPSFLTTEQLMFTTQFSIGIDEQADDLQLQMNTLVNDQLLLTYTSSAPLNYSITDLAGRVISEGRLSAQMAPAASQLDVSMLSPGMHLLTLQNKESGIHHTARFVKE